MASDDPMHLFAQERQQAWDAQDPSAALCTVANVNQAGEAELRTLVLRDVDGELAIFVNATSPKWPQLQAGLALQTYWPSVQVQYRLRMACTEIPSEVVHESWALRPQSPRRMDWLYHHIQPQSSSIESRERLLSELANLDEQEPLVAPPEARGLSLTAIEVERLDLNQPNGVHDRRRYRRTDSGWTATVLVP